MMAPPLGRATLSVFLAALPLATHANAQTAPSAATQPATRADAVSNTSTPYVIVLGIAQDGGYPQAGCKRECCASAWREPSSRRGVSCIALVDPDTRQRWMFDATPDFRRQLRMLDEIAPTTSVPGLAGILLTHAHIGHYTGLMHLGREVLGGSKVPVYAMPRMTEFLTSNGPWDQLVQLENIDVRSLRADQTLILNTRLKVTPLLVPHRDEYSETVGFYIEGPRRSVLYIPDIDKWNRWDRDIGQLVGEVDVAYLDGTFFADGEIGRSMAEIPHPFIEESMRRFEALAPEQRAKIHFIHLNHTNPALRPGSDARRQVENSGFRIAEVRDRVAL